MTQYEQGYTDGELDGRNIGYQEGIKQGYKIMSELILQKVEQERYKIEDDFDRGFNVGLNTISEYIKGFESESVSK